MKNLIGKTLFLGFLGFSLVMPSFSHAGGTIQFQKVESESKVEFQEVNDIHVTTSCMEECLDEKEGEIDSIKNFECSRLCSEEAIIHNVKK